MIRAARTRVRAGGAVLALLAVAGCATSIAGRGELAADAALAAPTGAAPGPSPGGSAPATPAPDARGGTASLGRVRLPLPPGATARADAGMLCVTLAGDSGCSLEVLDVRAVRAAGGSISTPDPRKPNGWWWGSDAPSCRGDGTVPVTGSRVVERGFRPVGDRTAEYGSWQVSCQDPDLGFAPRLWWLPRTQLAFRQRSAAAGRGAAVDRLLAGVRFR